MKIDESFEGMFGYGHNLINNLNFLYDKSIIEIEPSKDNGMLYDIDKLNKVMTFSYLKFQQNDFHSFSITQDNKKVLIHTVIVESKLIKGSKPDYYTLEITYNYLHKLTFKANGYSTLYTSYNSPFMDSYKKMQSSSYQWNYIIGTGGTWKGNISKIYLFTNIRGGNKIRNFNFLGSYYDYDLFCIDNYKPVKDETIQLYWTYYSSFNEDYEEQMNTKFILLDDRPEGVIPDKPFQSNIVKIIGASSYINEKTTVYDKKNKYTNIDYTPLRLFDGLRESAWCESVKGSGINEWVEFELKQDILGLSIYNGFARYYYTDYMNDDIDGKVRTKVEKYYNLFYENNRVKQLKIESNDGKIKQLINLKDIREIQNFYDIFLPSGKYKLYITDVYKGSKYDDTCLSEIVFMYGSAKKIFDNDSFLKDVLLKFNIKSNSNIIR